MTDPISNKRPEFKAETAFADHRIEHGLEPLPNIHIAGPNGFRAEFRDTPENRATANDLVTAWNRRQSPAGVEVSEKMLIDAFVRGESWRKRNDVLSVKPEGVEPVAWLVESVHENQVMSAEFTVIPRYADECRTKGWRLTPLYTSPPPKAVTISEEAVVLSAHDARKHAVELEQCAIFAADAGPSIAKAMTDAAAWLRAALSSEPHNGREVE